MPTNPVIAEAEAKVRSAQATLEALRAFEAQESPALIVAYFEAVAREEYSLSQALFSMLTGRADSSMIARAFVQQLTYGHEYA